MECPVAAPGHGRHHGDGDGGAVMGPIASNLLDAAGDVPQVVGDGASSSIHRVRCNLGCVEEGLDL